MLHHMAVSLANGYQESGWMLLKKSVKRKIRYHVQRLPAADYGFPGHDNPRSGPGQARTEKIPEKS